MLKNFRLIQKFTASCRARVLNCPLRKHFNTNNGKPSNEKLPNDNIKSNEYSQGGSSKIRSIFPVAASSLAVAAFLAIVYDSYYRKSQEPVAKKPFEAFNDPNNKFAFSGEKKELLEDVISVGRLNSFLLKDMPSLLEKKKGLYVIVGESGIGKTEAFKYFANEWKKQGSPGNYVSCAADTTITTFLNECFETSDKAEIKKEVQRWISLKECPLLIVDNIHKLYKNDQFEAGILDFLKDFSDNGGKVFMLSSVSDISYKLPSYSGYSSRVLIREIRPRDKATMERYIREQINPTRQVKWSNEEIAIFVDYFDGNMAKTNSLTAQGVATFEEVIQDAKSSVKRDLDSYFASNPEAKKFLYQLLKDKGDELVDWCSLKEEFLTTGNQHKLLDFVRKDFMINKETFLFKLKNGLVREVLTEYFKSH